ncbi:MAG: metal-dependent hydrolase [Desulfuromonas sp.]|nr:MAG: metal-dependent hydrolase [Desulfuromonas sp.]
MLTGRRKSSRPRRGQHLFIEVEGVTVEVIRKRVKNLNLRVCPPVGDVTISVPLKIDNQAIHSFVTSKLDWIKQSRDRITQRTRKPQPQMLSGETHSFLGESYHLDVITSPGRSRVCLENGAMCLFVPEGSDLLFRTRILDNWYRRQLMERIPQLLQKWQPVVGVQVSECRVKKMKTRWGSCNVVAKRIWLNLELAKRSLACLEYVLVHELVHLHERRHNDRFYAFLDQFLPQWRRFRAELRENALK